MTEIDRATAHSEHVIRRIKALRRARRWTAQQLADEMKAAGIPWNRSIVANIELGRRSYITVDELWALADVFGLIPVDLAAIGPTCPICRDAPPVGYICRTCGAEGTERA